VATASVDHTARLWDAASGEPLASLEGHTDWVFSAAFNHDGSRIVTASSDRTAKVWAITPAVA
jgi:WD40 repeat protein